MSWFGNFNNQQSFFETLCYKVVKMGKIPKHIAVIMDGNRRYAKKENITRKEGHTAGFEKLAQVKLSVEWSRPFELDVLFWGLDPIYDVFS